MEQTVILGAGPAGLAAAWRLARTGHPVTVVEREQAVGGLCRSFELDGCLFDIGPHLFKPRSEEVAALWDLGCEGDYVRHGTESAPIYFEGALHHSNSEAILAQPWWKIARMGARFLSRTLRPADVHSAEDLLRNMRGEEIYQALYRSHEEKFWGRPLSQIDPSFYVTQTVDLSTSLPSLVAAALRSRFGSSSGAGAVEPKPEEPTAPLALASRFPSRGAGALYDRIRELAEADGQALFMLGTELVAVEHAEGRVRAVIVRGSGGGVEQRIEATNLVSTIPIQVLIASLDPQPETSVATDAAKLFHRDLVSVNLILAPEPRFPHERIEAFSAAVELFRITHFSGFTPRMASRLGHQSVGVEYYCFRDDERWQSSDEDLVALATRELAAIGLIKERDVIRGKAIRVKEACPVQIRGHREIRTRLLDHLVGLGNIQSIGRNGLFTYNQMSHSVDCGLRAAENVLGANHRIDPPGLRESVVF